MTDLVSHALALLIGVLIGVVGKAWYEDLRERSRRADGRVRTGTVLTIVVAASASAVLLATPLGLYELAHWRGIRWAVAVTCGAAALTMARSIVRLWPDMSRRMRAVAPAVVAAISAEAYFQVEAWFVGVPVTGIRNVVMLLVYALLTTVQWIDWDKTERRK